MNVYIRSNLRDFPTDVPKIFRHGALAKSRQNESPGNRIALNFNRIRPTRSVSVNKCSISCSLTCDFSWQKGLSGELSTAKH